MFLQSGKHRSEFVPPSYGVMMQFLTPAKLTENNFSESLEEAVESRPDCKIGIGGRYNDERRRCGTRAKPPLQLRNRGTA